MEKCPENLEFISDAVISNFDHEINRDVELLLRQRDCCAEYPAWNFWGLVWYDGRFKCQVMRYRAHVETLEAETLEEIMNAASERWGWA